ncbi:MAG: MBL fold metallo-hydrolase [Vicinamibacterales bacterium]
MRIFTLLLCVAVAVAVPAAQAPTATLDIYYIDTEGGQATLFVSPTHQSVLVDTGNAGSRDPDRIVEAARAAGIQQIDYLVVTHYHGDHIGGFLELSKKIPIVNIVDHGPTVQPEQVSPSRTLYEETKAKGHYTVAKPGDRVPVTGVTWTIVTAAGKTLKTNVAGAPGAGTANTLCAEFKPKDVQVDLENAMSTGSLIAFGKFRTIDLGDLLWNVEGDLMCPINHIGTVDVYLTTHHGLDWSNSKQTVHALQPRVAIMNNGTRKGGQLETFQTLETSPGLEDLWQLHWSYNGLLEHNAPARFIANIDDNAQLSAVIANPPVPATSVIGAPPARGGGVGGPAPAPAGAPAPAVAGTAPQPSAYPAGPQGTAAHTPSYWIKVSARADGSFTVTNSRNGFSKTYAARR